MALQLVSAAAPVLQGPVGRVCAEELGPDLLFILGDHAETISSLSPALLQTPKGASDFRAFLRHLRSLLGNRPGHMGQLQEGIAAMQGFTARETEAQLAAEQRARNDTAARLAADAQADTAVAELRRELGETCQALMAERAAWAVERADLLMEMEQEGTAGALAEQADTSELSKLRSSWQRDGASGRLHLDAQSKALQARQHEHARRSGELVWVWELIAEQKTAMSGLKLMLQCSEERNVHTREEAQQRYQEQISARVVEMERISDESLRLGA